MTRIKISDVVIYANDFNRPIRKYFADIVQSYGEKDLESGQYYGDELTSSNGDRNDQFGRPVVYQDLGKLN